MATPSRTVRALMRRRPPVAAHHRPELLDDAGEHQANLVSLSRSVSMSTKLSGGMVDAAQVDTQVLAETWSTAQ